MSLYCPVIENMHLWNALSRMYPHTKIKLQFCSSIMSALESEKSLQYLADLWGWEGADRPCPPPPPPPQPPLLSQVCAPPPPPQKRKKEKRKNHCSVVVCPSLTSKFHIIHLYECDGVGVEKGVGNITCSVKEEGY